MPELPEVETVRRGLELGVLGKRIINAKQFRDDIRFPLPHHLSSRIERSEIYAIGRRGKYLLFDIGGLQMVGHLGMSGSFIIRPQSHPIQKHDHLVWELDDGNCVVYHDPRRFGFLLEAPEGWELHKMIKNLGPEPLHDEFNPHYLADQLSRRKGPIKNILLDQSVVAGLGNIYVCEALFRTSLHPAMSGADASEYASVLVPIIKEVLEEALMSGGSTLRNYATASGDTGYFQHKFQVYGREKKACHQCACIIERIVQAGRSSFFCPACQKI